jgi:hypothetical protein
MERDPHIRQWTPRTISGTGRNAAGSTDSGSGSPGRRQEDPRPFPGVGQVRKIAWGARPLGSVILEGPTVGGVRPEQLTRFPIIDRRLRNAEPLAREVMQDYERSRVDRGASPAFLQPELTE